MGSKVFCGVDWSERHHDVALVDEQGTLLAKRRIGDDLAGFTELVPLLADAGDSATSPIPVAIETPRGLLVAALRSSGRLVYSINPMAVARYRERITVSRKKSDHADAMVLANILRTDAHLHRVLPQDSELVQAIAVLARAHQDATWRRSRASNELRSLLREFYPVFLNAFIAASHCEPTKQHYQRRRDQGDRHAAALPHLFNRMLGQLHHCLQTGQTYDPIKAFGPTAAHPQAAAA